MTVTYTQGHELPAWVATVTANGTLPNLSTGWTFSLSMKKAGETTIDKTTGFTGAADGVVTVEWDAGELDDIAAGTWRLLLTAQRDSDQKKFPVHERMYVRAA